MANEFRRSVQDFAAGLGLIALTLLIFGISQFDAQNPAAASAFQVPDPEQQQAKGETFVVKTIPPLSISGVSVPPKPKNDPKPSTPPENQYPVVANFGDNVKVLRKDSGALCLEMLNQTEPMYLVQRNDNQFYLTNDLNLMSTLQSSATVAPVPHQPALQPGIREMITAPVPDWLVRTFLMVVALSSFAYLLFNIYKLRQAILAAARQQALLQTAPATRAEKP